MLVLATVPVTSAGAPPDGRAYEQVTPADKQGYQVGGNQSAAAEPAVSADGARIAYSSVYPYGPSRSGSLSGYLSSRASDGWVTESALPAPGPNQIGYGLPGQDTTLRGTTPDQRAAVYFDTTVPPYGALALLRKDGTRVRIADATAQGAGAGQLDGQPWFQGISDDGRHVLFTSTSRLVPGLPDPVGGAVLYEWVDDGGNGTLRVVNRDDQSTLTLLDPGPASLGGSSSSILAKIFGEASLRNAISRDGERIFFQNPAPDVAPSGESAGGGPVYLRQGGSATVEVSAPEVGYVPVSTPTRRQFLDATPNGSQVFFWADGDLVNGAPPTGGVYRYDVDAAQLTFLTEAPDNAGAAPTAMVSDAGDRLYFQRGTDLVLYSGGATRVVLADTQVQGGSFSLGAISALPGIRDDACPTANLSADGRFFTFTARTGSTLADQTVYRYDADTGVLDAVTSTLAGFTGAGACGVYYPRQIAARVMSEDGRYVFFDSQAPLVPEDTNGRVDAYRWHDGGVALLSDGTGPGDSLFVGADRTGANAFIVTADPLVRQDRDSENDLYDARIGGGFQPPAEREACSGDACQGAPSPALPGSSPGSAVFDGPGDVDVAPAPAVVVGRLSKRALRAFARTGRTTVTARVNGGGGVRATLAIAVGPRFRVIDSARRATTRPGTVALQLTLTRRARRSLARSEDGLRVRIDVRYSRAEQTSRQEYVLVPVSRARSGGRHG